MADIAHNSKAKRDYHILDTFEAGIVLHGSEVKALRAGKAQINDAFARVEKDEVWLYNAHIDEYAQANRFGHQPKAPRKLLLHKSEIRKLFGFAAVKGKRAFPALVLLEDGKGQSRAGGGQRKGGIRQAGTTSRNGSPTAN